MATYYAKPADMVTASATLSLTAGTAESSYPLTNLADLRPDKPFKANETAATIRATFGGAKALQAVGFIHHNLHGLTVTVTNNNSMASQSLVIPAIGDDSYPINPWLNIAAVTTSATQWNFAITGAAANVAIGDLILVETLRTMDITWGVTHSDRHPVIEHRTEYDVPLIYDLGLRYRLFTGAVVREDQRSAITSLHRGAKGRVTPFWFVPESGNNDAMLVRFVGVELPWERVHARHSKATIDLEETSAGVAL
jgi:hypothetical protein